MDWQHFYDGVWLPAIKIKLTLALTLILLVCVGAALVHWKKGGPGIVLTIYVISFAVVVVLGYTGGGLVYGGTRSKTSDAFAAGKASFDQNCAACHPNGGNVIVPASPILNSAHAKSPATLLAFIRNPTLPDGSVGPMPSFAASQVSDQQSVELYNYIANELQH
jgi:cytochrome c553